MKVTGPLLDALKSLARRNWLTPGEYLALLVQEAQEEQDYLDYQREIHRHTPGELLIIPKNLLEAIQTLAARHRLTPEDWLAAIVRVEEERADIFSIAKEFSEINQNE